ncbi:5'-nucleotidase [Caerostris extrusa]|uniref:5'-nucleotidase n=1 Tax=Caerostris extrusa TaxID=172846 RepID=A0AAV4S1W2_CAEEX|nr:5'-nucleotidase [Caerostris extrusa]
MRIEALSFVCCLECYYHRAQQNDDSVFLFQSLSNHDFSSGIFELSAFLYGMKFPVLCANMRARETSFLHSRVNKSVVLDINGERIGIIGYLHPEALDKSRKGKRIIDLSLYMKIGRFHVQFFVSCEQPLN